MQQNDKKPVILCGIAGGIAVYKTVEVVSRLHQAGYDVRVVMTPSACRFVAPLTFQAVTGKPVRSEMFCAPEADQPEDIYPHLFPSTQADLFLVMPATADILAKIAGGQADDLVCGSALGLRPECVKVFCPAMNTHMLNQEVVQANIACLERRGWLRIGPSEGNLACGTKGGGRMTEPESIVQGVRSFLEKRRDMAGRRVLILSGPTREHLDPVRFIGNASSGRMGRALAEEAAARGAEVNFVTGPVAQEQLPRGQRIAVHPVVSAESMLAAARGLFDAADVIVFAAAVADYKPMQSSGAKRPKEEADWTLTLQPTPDIAASLCAGKRPGQQAVGFALQDGEAAREKAASKLRSKHLDMIVLNDPSAMEADDAIYEVLTTTQGNFEEWGRLAKRDCAKRIFDVIATRTICN